MYWTAEEDAVLMAHSGKTASVLAKMLGRPRASVLGRSWRLKQPQKPPSPRTGPLRPWTQDDEEALKKHAAEGLTAKRAGLLIGRTEEAMHKRASALKVKFHGKREPKPKSNVVKFKPAKKPRAMPAPAAIEEAPRPKLTVASNNVPMMVQDWLAKHGGARRFERGESTDLYAMDNYLRGHGYRVGGGHGGRKPYIVTDSRGRKRTLSHAELFSFVDKLRKQDGKQPFKAVS